MSPERWHHLQTLLTEALDLPSEERPAFLRKTDSDFRRDLEELLDAATEADAFFNHLQDEVLPGLLPPLEEHAPPDRIGPYHVRREVGHGGMGTVYLAEREDVGKQVALKVGHGSHISPERRARFFHEQRVLARLQHPNIAALHDAGIAGDGTPYFAMEFVEGAPITRYCTEQRCPLETRLALFQEVCRAVHYAHQNLIVHRDLKPSNILVTEADGQPQVKLLDFGIARLLEDEAPGLTRPDQRLMTPEYASPEQRRGEVVTTASDVYQLGLLLYELLTGRAPFADAPAPDAEPEPPSTAVTEASALPAPAGRLRRRLEGDLDTITLMALRAEPERRYGSAEQFLDDIKRHLAGLPVVARRDTLGYRLRKFVQRNRAAVAGTAAFLVLLIGFSMFTLVQAAQIRRQAEATARERDRAESVTHFLISVFETSDPNEAQGKTITARELLATGAARIGEELAGQPDVQVELLNVMGEVYQNLGLYDDARAVLERALRIARTLPPRSDALPTTLYDLAELEALAVDYPRADSLYRAGLALRGTAYPRHSNLASIGLQGLAHVLVYQSRLDEAEPLLQEAVEVTRATHPENSLELAAVMATLANLREQQGQLDEAARLYREVLAIRRAHHGQWHSDVGEALNNLTIILSSSGQLDEAESLAVESQELARHLYGPDHPNYAIALNTLADFRKQRGAFAEVDSIYREVEAILTRAVGANHPYVALTLNNRASLLRSMNRMEEAESVGREAAARLHAAFGETHVYTLLARFNLGTVLVEREQWEEGERVLRSVQQQFEATLGAEHPYTALSTLTVARLLLRTDRLAEAEIQAREALRRYEALHPGGHPDIANALVTLGLTLARTDRAAEAEPLMRRALTLLSTDRPSLIRAEAHQHTAEVLLRLGRSAEAAEHLQQSQALFTALNRPDRAEQAEVGFRRLISQ